MKTIIYYFSGTGNSLAVAKGIAAVLGETDLVPITSRAGGDGEIVPAAARVGIVCPVYFSGLPAMVASWAERLRPAGGAYLFGVVTLGGTGGRSALRQLDGILRRGSSRGLDAGFAVKMPGNYILMYEPPGGKRRASLLAAADREIARIADAVGRFRHETLPRPILERLLHALLYPRFISRVHERDHIFSVTEACTSCGTCVAVCPAENISLVEGRPVWKHHCELCCGCIHACPVLAIQAGRATISRQRYRHPGVTIAELEHRPPGQA